MPNRVVTIDIEQMLGGVRLLAATARPYNPSGLIVPWVGGYFVDCIIEGEGADFDALDPDCWEHGGTTPQRLTEGDAGARHTFLGWARPEAPPAEPQLGLRRAVVSFDVGARIGARMLQAERLRIGQGGVIQAEVDSPVPDASTLDLLVYDAMDDHPEAIRSAIADQVERRQSSSDEPIGWEQRRRPEPL
jgi:hypothetical protein